MHIRRTILALLLSFLAPTATLRAVDDVFITEFMAVNGGPLTDENGDFSDWIELHNGGTNIVNLDGWYLTDRANDLKQWRFPSTNLPPNAYLLVFASGKDRRVPGAPLHTNFRLGSDGEYLGLVRPDGLTVASAYAPAYPPQIAGASFGLALRQTQTTLIASGAVARVTVPADGFLGSSWNGLLFNDSGWASVPTGVGFEAGGGGPFVPSAIANSVTEFSGFQGLDNWYYGYWNQKIDADGTYAASEFVPFPNSGGAFGPNNYWTGSLWDWPAGDPPFTQVTSQGGRPTADFGSPALASHWAVRRYVNEHNGPVTISGRITHTSDWVYVTATGVSASSLLYIYLTDVGEGYIDDVRLVAGTDPGVGANLIANGDFETQGLNPNWTVSPNLAGSATTTAVRKTGTRSLRLVSTGGGASQSSSIYQTISPALTAGGLYTLSYWYLPVVTNQAPLVVRFSGSWIDTTPTYCGDGVIARVLVDGVPVYSQRAHVSSTDYSITVPATLGSTIDFALDPGTSADGDCDDAIFTGIVTSEDPNSGVVADSVRDWSLTGVQGENNWYYGYWDAGTNIPPAAYTASNFTPFPRNGGPFSAANFWTGREWDWWAGDPPVDEIGQRLMWANGFNNTNIHWVIRRWVSEVAGPITVNWTVAKLEASGAGVTVRIFHNGTQRDFLTLPGTNAPLVQRSVSINNVQIGDAIDIALDPLGFNSAYGDGGDPCLVTAVIRGSPSLADQIATDIGPDMQGANATAYLRIPFTVADPAAVQFLTLRMKHDDGFAAWINGVPVASDNAPAELAWNSTATAVRADGDARHFTEFNLTPQRGALQIGANVLAIQGLNASANDPDFLILPELIATRLELATNSGLYFGLQTPGAANGFGQTNLGPVITTAQHTPNAPADDQNLVVTASVRPSFLPIGTVRLYYRTMFGAESQLTMFDDGAHLDGAAGDGVYGATIPASAAGPGQMLRYYVYATDSQGNGARFPAYGDPLNSPQYQGTVVLNPAHTNPLPVLHMFVQNPVLATNSTGTRCSLFYDGEFYDNVAINLHGQTTAFVFPKRSMDIDLNRGFSFRWKEGQARINDFVLLTPIADKAYVRQPLAYETFANAGVPSHFNFPVRVEQNGAFFGVFFLGEKGDDNFLERVGLDPQGALYKVYLPLTNAYGGVAEKKTRQGEPNDDLDALVKGTSQSGQPLRNFVYDNIDIPEFINFLATIQLVQNEDCCWFKNYYLYRDTRGSGEWQMLPWDLDLTFGRTFGFFVLNNQQINGYFNTNIYWTNAYYSQARSTYDYIGIAQPVVNALFTIPETFDMFLRRWTTVQLDFLRTNNSHPLLLNLERRADELANVIRPDAALDFNKWGNWFPTQTIDTAVQVLKTEYFARRRGWVFNTLAFANGGPYVGPQPSNAVVRFAGIDYNPAEGQNQEYIQVTNANTYAIDISGWRISGGVEHTFKPGTVIPARNVIYVSPDVNGFRARTTGPRGGLGLFVQGNYRGQLSAWGEPLQITDPTGRLVSSTNTPATPSALQRYLRITEIHYNPSPLAGSGLDAQEYEYIELKNIGPISLNLAGVTLSGGVDFRFATTTTLGAGQSILLVRNAAAFAARYGAGLPVGGQYTGTLDNAGETLRLDDATGEKILELTYDNRWQPITDGFGFALVVANEATPWDAWGQPSNWRASSQPNGSPGVSNPPAPTFVAVRINEVLSASVPPATDAIELFNPSASTPATIGGWFLTDDFRTPRKYRVPDNTTIPPLGYLVLTEAQFNPANPPSATGFAFSSNGDEAYLFSADAAGNLTGYFHGFNFGAAEPGVTFGRHVISTGAEQFVAQAAPSLGAANGAPRVGPLVISEIHYHPASRTGSGDNEDDEFIEIRNLTASPVPLFDPAFPTNRWALSGGVGLLFPANLTLDPGAALLAVNFNPTNTARLLDFKSRVFVPAGTRIVGPLEGKLDNSSDTIALFRPGTPVLGVAPWILMDLVDYSDELPWPALADGTGASLQKRTASVHGNDPAAWSAARPSAGQPFAGGTPPAITQQPLNVLTGATMNAVFSLGASGSFPLSYQWYYGDESIPGATNASLALPNVQFSQQGDYHAVVYNGAGAALSSNATLRLLLPPYFTLPPSNALVRIRPDPLAAPTTNATFSAQGRGALGTLRYQWYFKGQPIPGATSQTLTITNVQLANGGEYSAAISDDIGTVFSPVFLYPLISPTYVQQPIGQTVAVGSTVTLSTVVSGSPTPFTYEWRRGTTTIASFTSDSTNGFYTFTAASIPSNVLYRVIVKNLANNAPGVASANASITTVADSDGDGMTDAWESTYALNFFDPADRFADLDGDGSNNGDEFIAGTDPTDPSSYLKVDSISAANGATLRFGTVASRTYTIQFKDSLDADTWSRLADVPARAAAGSEQIVDPTFTPGRFYRLVTPRQP